MVELLDMQMQEDNGSTLGGTITMHAALRKSCDAAVTLTLESRNVLHILCQDADSVKAVFLIESDASAGLIKLTHTHTHARTHTNLSNAFAHSGFRPMPFKCV